MDLLPCILLSENLAYIHTRPDTQAEYHHSPVQMVNWRSGEILGKLGSKPKKLLSFWHFCKKLVLGTNWKKCRLDNWIGDPQIQIFTTQMCGSPLLESILFHFIEQIRFWAAKVDNLWTAVSVLLLYGALLAVVSIRYAWPSTNHTTTLKIFLSKNFNFVFWSRIANVKVE